MRITLPAGSVIEYSRMPHGCSITSPISTSGAFDRMASCQSSTSPTWTNAAALDAPASRPSARARWKILPSARTHPRVSGVVGADCEADRPIERDHGIHVVHRQDRVDGRPVRHVRQRRLVVGRRRKARKTSTCEPADVARRFPERRHRGRLVRPASTGERLETLGQVFGSGSLAERLVQDVAM